MRWYWFTLLIPICFIVLIATERPKIGSYQAVELEHDKITQSFFVFVDGQDINVFGFDKADTMDMYSGMTVYCLKSSQERWTKNWEYHFSPIDVNPNEWIKEIYPNANEGRGQVIFIFILVFLIMVMLFSFIPEKIRIIHADSD